MKKFAVLCAVVGSLVAASAAAETLNNDAVVTLVSAGLGDEAVIAKIKASEHQFDLSTEQLIALKKAGVSGAIIAAMVERTMPSKEAVPARAKLSMDSPDPMTPHPSGVYLLNGGDMPRMQRIDATVTNQAKTGGILGYALTGGIASMSIKASIQNESARAKVQERRPAFYFFFDESNPDMVQSSSWLAGSTSVVTSPNEFTLVRLTKKAGRREARVGSMNIAGGKTGVMDKDRIPFQYEMVRPGVFKVAPDIDLSAGEYGFISSVAGGGQAGAMTARIFDFSVN